MFYDWVKVTQEHSAQLPFLGDTVLEVYTDGELMKQIQPRHKHEGSFSTSIQITIRGNIITVDGNPSRYNRLDNVIGLSSLDACIEVYNKILAELNLPPFTKCTKLWQGQASKNGKTPWYSDGAYFQRLDLTSNIVTGGNARDYIRGVSTQRYRNSIPRLHTNGKTCDWLSASGKARLMYPKLYDKANELRLHALGKAKRSKNFTPENVQYLENLVSYLEAHGVVRFEQELHSEFLSRENFRYWGLFKESDLKEIHEDFVNIDEKLHVESLDMISISEKLIKEGVVESTRSANSTASYVFLWMSGQKFDFKKSQMQIHRARLRQIGIDIAAEYDQSRFSPVYIEKAKRIEVTPMLTMPKWYQMPNQNHLRVA